MNIDVIILSNALNNNLRAITTECIKSLYLSERDITFNTIVLEQQEFIDYSHINNNVETHTILSSFNYNRFMNYGIEQGHYKYVALCNSDLVFSKGWASAIIGAMEENAILSASPFCPWSQGKRRYSSDNKEFPEIAYGYRIGYEMSGWCIVINRVLLGIIGRLNEEFPFWYADNAYCEQLKQKNIQHALIKNSIVTHLGSKTLDTLQEHHRTSYTTAEQKRWANRIKNGQPF